MCQFCGLPPGGHGLVTQALGLLASVSAIATALFAASWAIGWRRIGCLIQRLRNDTAALEQHERREPEHEHEAKNVGGGRNENG